MAVSLKVRKSVGELNTPRRAADDGARPAQTTQQTNGRHQHTTIMPRNKKASRRPSATLETTTRDPATMTDPEALAAHAAALQAELKAVEEKLLQCGLSKPAATLYGFQYGLSDPNVLPELTAKDGEESELTVHAAVDEFQTHEDLADIDDAKLPLHRTSLVSALRCKQLLLLLPVSSLAALLSISSEFRKIVSSAATWRWLYSHAFPHEYPPTSGDDADEPVHPLPSFTWQRLYCERLLDGAAAVPCFLHSPATMARATLDPGAVHLVEAYLARLCSQLAGMHAKLLHPSDDPASLEAALGECSRLLAVSEGSAPCAAKMILRQLESSNRAFGCDGATVWSFEQERSQLTTRFKELASAKQLYSRFVGGGRAAAPGGNVSTNAGGGGSVGVAPPMLEPLPASPSEPQPSSAALPPLQPIALRIGAACEAIREAGDDEWEPATITALDVERGTVSLLFADRFRAPSVPLPRVRPMMKEVPKTKIAGSAASAATATDDAAASSSPKGESPTLALLVGQRVRIHGLVGRPELNGTCGLARSFDAQTGRYAVRLDADGTRVALKPANLVREEAAAAKQEADVPSAGLPSGGAAVSGRTKANGDGEESRTAKHSDRPSSGLHAGRPSQEQARSLYAQLWNERASKRASGTGAE